jgi:hypothetical protein
VGMLPLFTRYNAELFLRLYYLKRQVNTHPRMCTCSLVCMYTFACTLAFNPLVSWYMCACCAFNVTTFTTLSHPGPS